MKVRSFFLKTICPLILAAIAACSLGGCALFPDEEEDLPAPVLEFYEATYFTSHPFKGTLERVVEGVATVIARSSTNVAFASSCGTLKEMYFSVGDEVQEGDILCEASNEALKEKLFVAEMQYEIDELVYQEACEAFDQGKITKSQMKKAELAIYLSRRDIEALRTEYSATVVKAPCSGVITYASNMPKGSSVTGGTTMYTISDMDDLFAKYAATGYDEFGIGSECILSDRMRKHEGEINAVCVQSADNRPIDAYDTNCVYLKPETIPDWFELGTKLNVYFLSAKSEDTLYVHTAAIQTAGDRKFVYVVENGVKQEKDIVTGIVSGIYTEVLEGLSENDDVIQ